MPKGWSSGTSSHVVTCGLLRRWGRSVVKVRVLVDEAEGGELDERVEHPAAAVCREAGSDSCRVDRRHARDARSVSSSALVCARTRASSGASAPSSASWVATTTLSRPCCSLARRRLAPRRVVQTAGQLEREPVQDHGVEEAAEHVFVGPGPRRGGPGAELCCHVGLVVDRVGDVVEPGSLVGTHADLDDDGDLEGQHRAPVRRPAHLDPGDDDMVVVAQCGHGVDRGLHRASRGRSDEAQGAAAAGGGARVTPRPGCAASAASGGGDEERAEVAGIRLRSAGRGARAPRRRAARGPGGKTAASSMRRSNSGVLDMWRERTPLWQ